MKFKQGNIVYHKSTLKRGLVMTDIGNRIDILWEDNEEHFHYLFELMSEEEYLTVKHWRKTDEPK